MDTASLPNNSAGKDSTIGGQIASERKPSRRDLLKTGASIAAAGSAIPLSQATLLPRARMPMLAHLIACSERSATGDAASC